MSLLLDVVLEVNVFRGLAVKLPRDGSGVLCAAGQRDGICVVPLRHHDCTFMGRTRRTDLEPFEVSFCFLNVRRVKKKSHTVFWEVARPLCSTQADEEKSK